MTDDNQGYRPPERFADGRFKPGHGGKPKGSRRKTSQLAEKMLGDASKAIIEAAIEAAKQGDPTALKVCMDRIAPLRKGALVEVDDLPPLETAKDVPAAIAALLRAVAEGKLTPDEAHSLAGLVEAGRKAIELADIEARIAALEAKQG